MTGTLQVDHIPEGQPLGKAGSTPQLETPLIQTQDLEHVATPATRVSNAGVKVTPRMNSEDRRDQKMEDEAAIQALEQIEKEMQGASF